MMFLTKAKINAALLVALEEQKNHEAAAKEKFDREQRIEAVIQRAEQKLNKQLKREEVRHGVEQALWVA